MQVPKALLSQFCEAANKHAIVAVTDRRGVITHVNNNFCAISGFSESELLGQTHSKINSGKHSPKFFQDLWSVISRGQVWQGKICNKKKSGELYWVQTTIYPCVNEQNQVTHYLALRTDVTELVTLAESLTQQSWQLQTERRNLRKKHDALAEVLNQLEEKKIKQQEDIYHNIKYLVEPILAELTASRAPQPLIKLLRNTLYQVFEKVLPQQHMLRLSPKENLIANMIVSGMTNKDMASVLKTSVRTIEKHREHIRRKLNLNNSRTSLAVYLQARQKELD